MNKKTLSATALPLFTVVSVALSSSFTAQAQVVDSFHQSVSGASAKNLRLGNVNGDVEINAWAENYIDIVATITADNQRERERIRIEVIERDEEVSVETKYAENGWRDSHGGKVEYQLKVPMNTNLAEIDLVNGELEVNKVKGAVSANVVNGSIHSDGSAANLTLNVVNGGIYAQLVEASQLVSAIDLQTVNGTINLVVPADISASFDAETMHGSIKSDFDLEHSKGMFVGREATGSVGSGDISVRLETVNGSIKIRKN